MSTLRTSASTGRVRTVEGIKLEIFFQLFVKMFLRLKSNYGRTMGTLYSAMQKAVRRSDAHTAVQVALEMHDRGYGKAAFGRLMVISVEDCFPSGAKYLGSMQTDFKDWSKYSKDQQTELLVVYATHLANSTHDRAAAYSARVAMYDVKTGGEPPTEERKLGAKCEKILLSIRKSKETHCPGDMTPERGFEKMEKLLDLSNTPNRVCFQKLKKEFVKEGSLTSRLYLYTIVGRMFHEFDDVARMSFSVDIPKLEKVELQDFVYDKHTLEGKKRKRGLEHFLKEGAAITNPSPGIEKRTAVKRLAEEIYTKDEELYGTKEANSRHERKRLRSGFMKLQQLHGSRVISMTQIQKPCGGKPITYYVETENVGTENGKFFLKGPGSREAFEYQVKIDKDKLKYDLVAMGIEIIQENGLYYLCAPAAKGVNYDPSKFYPEYKLWNLIRVLIFRAAFNLSDTNLRNIMDCGEYALSVDEMSNKRENPTTVRDILDHLFSKGKVPRKSFAEQLRRVIKKRKDDFVKECEKYGKLTKHLI